MKARHAGGFTLIELMIAVAIVGILAAVAYPNYTNYLRDSRRADCKAVMLSAANKLEREFSIENSYPAEPAEGEVGPLAGFACPIGGDATTYDLAYAQEDGGAGFTLTATPTGAQTHDRCGALELTNTGKRSADGTGICW
ncbi:type IV pilin protein [Thauera sp. SDU_THAU2]|uniref:type IV pilin protein n=1 Tax=Thauera sp. SDU_THAU2 TaxID=3136633 RepID=UPI00311F9E89